LLYKKCDIASAGHWEADRDLVGLWTVDRSHVGTSAADRVDVAADADLSAARGSTDPIGFGKADRAVGRALMTRYELFF
jgi:hypothetical protein